MMEHERRGRTAVLVAVNSEFNMKSSLFAIISLPTDEGFVLA